MPLGGAFDSRTLQLQQHRGGGALIGLYYFIRQRCLQDFSNDSREKCTCVSVCREPRWPSSLACATSLILFSVFLPVIFSIYFQNMPIPSLQTPHYVHFQINSPLSCHHVLMLGRPVQWLASKVLPLNTGRAVLLCDLGSFKLLGWTINIAGT